MAFSSIPTHVNGANHLASPLPLSVLTVGTGGLVLWLPAEGTPLGKTQKKKLWLSWIKSRSESRFFVESDCLNFCSSFISVRKDFSIFGLVSKQCRLIAYDIGNALVHHVNRSANQVAHVLARATDSSSVLRVWESTPPSCISHWFWYMIFPLFFKKKKKVSIHVISNLIFKFRWIPLDFCFVLFFFFFVFFCFCFFFFFILVLSMSLY